MSDIAFSVIVNNNGIDDIVFKTIMLKGDKGNSVDHVEKTSTSGLVDTYTIYLTDGTIGGTFTVTNGSPVNIDDTVTAVDKTWSSNKLSGMIKSIDDNVVNADKLWSSQKINSMLAQTGTIEDVAIASFSDGADDLPLSELIVDIEAWQEGSGDPSPDNERAIHGWNKCNIIKSNTNLWDEQWELGSFAGGNLQPSTTRIRNKNPIPVKPNTTYFLKSSTSVYIMDVDKETEWTQYQSRNVNADSTFTTNSWAKYIYLSPVDAYGTTYNNDISINYPADDTSYHAHDGGVDTIDLTVLVGNGSLNVLTGELTIDHKIDDFSSNAFSWSYDGSRWQSILSGMKNYPSRSDDIIAEKYKTDTTASSGAENKIFTVGGAIYIYTSDSANHPTGKCKYPLATPETIQLTPTEVRTLLNANNIYADTGNIEKLVYFKTGSEAVARMIEAYMRAQPEE